MIWVRPLPNERESRHICQERSYAEEGYGEESSSREGRRQEGVEKGIATLKRRCGQPDSREPSCHCLRGARMKRWLLSLGALLAVAACDSQPGTSTTNPLPGGGQQAPVDPNRPISIDEERTLIWNAVWQEYLSDSCRPEQITRGSSSTNDDADGARQMSAWIEQLLASGEYTLVEEQATGAPPRSNEQYWNQGVRRTYSYDDGGVRFRLRTDSGHGHYFHGGRGPQDVLWSSISSCTSLPTSVTILDTNFSADNKNASVTYTVQWRLNSFAQALNSSNLGSVSAPAERERQARLRRLDALGWRVESLY